MNTFDYGKSIVKGKIKAIAGGLSDDPKLEAEGTNEEMAGKVQEKIGPV